MWIQKNIMSFYFTSIRQCMKIVCETKLAGQETGCGLRLDIFLKYLDMSVLDIINLCPRDLEDLWSSHLMKDYSWYFIISEKTWRNLVKSLLSTQSQCINMTKEILFESQNKGSPVHWALAMCGSEEWLDHIETESWYMNFKYKKCKNVSNISVQQICYGFIFESFKWNKIVWTWRSKLFILMNVLSFCLY